MSNSTYCDDHYEQPDLVKNQEQMEKQIKRLKKKLDQAYDYIVDMVKLDPSDLCDVVEENYDGWCAKNCKNFNRDCLKKFFAHYKKED